MGSSPERYLITLKFHLKSVKKQEIELRPESPRSPWGLMISLKDLQDSKNLSVSQFIIASGKRSKLAKEKNTWCEVQEKPGSRFPCLVEIHEDMLHSPSNAVWQHLQNLAHKESGPQDYIVRIHLSDQTGQSWHAPRPQAYKNPLPGRIVQGFRSSFPGIRQGQALKAEFSWDCIGFEETFPAVLTLSCSVHIPDPWPRLLQKNDHIFVSM